ncbi:MAG: ComF family protein [Chloroflexi bacterium]|nr:ComF family protein [Chloroflexota bacterium]
MTQLPTLAKRLSRSALDLVFTPRCAGCKREGSYLCNPCLTAVHRLDAPYFPRGASPLDGAPREPLAIAAVYAPFVMQGAMRDAIHQLKYLGVRDIAPVLAAHLDDFLEQHHLDVDTIIPVPLHRDRLRQRGYNQAELIAKAVALWRGLPLDAHCVERTRHSPPQARSGSSGARWAQVRDVFRPTRPLFDKRILLIDDVCTTGATLDACAQALKNAGASSVIGLTVARQL